MIMMIVNGGRRGHILYESNWWFLQRKQTLRDDRPGGWCCLYVPFFLKSVLPAITKRREMSWSDYKNWLLPNLDLPRYLSSTKVSKREERMKVSKKGRIESWIENLQFHGFQSRFGTRIQGSIVASFMADKSTIPTNVTFFPQSSHNFFLTHRTNCSTAREQKSENASLQ